MDGSRIIVAQPVDAVIPRMGLVEHLHPLVAHADWDRLSVKLTSSLLSFVFFCLVFVVSDITSKLTFTYRNLRFKEKVFWNLAIVRAVYGVLCVIFGGWAFIYDAELPNDVVFGTTPTSHFAITTTIGFFLLECIMILFSDIYFRQFNILLNIHHWLALLSFVNIIYTGSTHYFAIRALILEMSTPFSCLCWTLLKADLAHTPLWKANQLVLVHTFHLRSVMECVFWYLTYVHWDRIWDAMPTVTFAFVYLQLTLVTFIMTPYWTYKKTVQLINPVDWNFEDSNKHKTENGTVKRE